MSTYRKLVVSEGRKENVRMVDVLNENCTDIGTCNQVHFNYVEIFKTTTNSEGSGRPQQ